MANKNISKPFNNTLYNLQTFLTSYLHYLHSHNQLQFLFSNLHKELSKTTKKLIQGMFFFNEMNLNFISVVTPNLKEIK